MNESEPTDEVSRQLNILSKAIVSSMVVISVAFTCLLVTRQAIYRRHELYFGSQTERGKLNIDVSLSIKRLPFKDASDKQREMHKCNNIRQKVSMQYSVAD